MHTLLYIMFKPTIFSLFVEISNNDYVLKKVNVINAFVLLQIYIYILHYIKKRMKIYMYRSEYKLIKFLV